MFRFTFLSEKISIVFATIISSNIFKNNGLRQTSTAIQNNCNLKNRVIKNITFPIFCSYFSCFVIAVIAFMCFATSQTHAQHYPYGVESPPCLPHNYSLIYKYPRLATHPPLSTDMPLNVLIGYIGFDSIARQSNVGALCQAVVNMPYNDTVRQALKFLYEMQNYNPVLFARYSNDSYSGQNISVADALSECIAQNLIDKSPMPYSDYAISFSSFIGHIRVADTFIICDSASSMPFPFNMAHIVNAEVIDVIKGNVMPECNDYYPSSENTKFIHNTNGTQSVASGACIQFSYRDHWNYPEANGINSAFIDSNGGRIISANRDYIVFLIMRSICKDDSHIYFDISPCGFSRSFGVYPIDNTGHIVDKDNEFGFGIGLTVEQFKAALHQRIYKLTHP